MKEIGRIEINFHSSLHPTNLLARKVTQSNNTMTTKPIHSIVLDAGPIIKNEPTTSTLLAQSEALYTIPSVVEEIRDATTRARIETTLLPFLKLRSPKTSSIKVITEFARRTGDLEVLSRPDIHLMALAYELECERNHGDWRLRSVPGQKRLNGSPPQTLEDKTTIEIGSSTGASPDGTQAVLQATILEKRGAWGAAAPPTPEPNHVQADDVQSTSEGQFRRTQIYPPDSKDSELEDGDLQRDSSDLPLAYTHGAKPLLAEHQEIGTESLESEGSDDDGWITPSNLKKHQEKDANNTSQPQEEPKTMQIALITSDYAMQNVLLRMNLNLLSPSLQRIRQVKTWVLRCHACFYITKDMTKQFCNRCGKPTLLRTSCSTDAQGNFKVHLKKNMQWNTRGNVYSIPKPVAGTSNGKTALGGGKGGWGQELILAEDQKEYIRAMTTEKRRKEKDLMDEDYLPSILSGDRGRAGGRPKIGAGKGVNSRKRR